MMEIFGIIFAVAVLGVAGYLAYVWFSIQHVSEDKDHDSY